ncbi:MAG TPA: hypothetical protein VFF91_12985 [Pseudoxanthomonas sp.]|nr:hypothetical protein [Pseudoxanthomonas sp.]
MPTPPPRIPPLAQLASAACLLLMPSLFSFLAAAPRDVYPRLPDNTAASANLEVRKVLHGEVAGVFASPGRDQVIAVADRHLFKFTADGRLLDTLDEPEDMHAAGVAFGADGYVDWALTGDRERKAYAPAVDGNGLSPAALAAALDQAEVVAFGRDDDGTTAWAWLWREGRAWKLDISRHYARVDPYCSRGAWWRDWNWRNTCLEGYTHPNRGLREVAPGPFEGKETAPRVEVAGFHRRHYHLEEGMAGQLLGATVGNVLKWVWDVPGAPPGRYWFGDADVRLQVQGETLRFKVFVPRTHGGYAFYRNMRWWEPEMPGAGPWFSVQRRDTMAYPGEEALLRYYAPDVGLYAVRPRGIDEVPPARREVPAWRPLFEGPQTWRSPVTGTVELASGGSVYRWLRRQPPPIHLDGMLPRVPVEPLWPDLYALPQALVVDWGSGEDAATLRVELAPEATRAAFDALGGAGTVDLVLDVPDLYGDTATMQVFLRRGTVRLPLPQARLAYLKRPAFRRGAGGTPTRAAQLSASVAAAGAGDAAALQDFLHKAQVLVQDPHDAERFAGTVTAAYAQLLNAYNLAGDAASAGTLVRHYLAQVHPRTHAITRDPSLPYNVGVIASQTLAFAVHQPQERALVDAVLATLIGPDFDPDAQPNATLAYNLACYYALAGDKPRLLRHAAAARRLGKPAEQFLRDADFRRYHDDADFLRAVR